MNVCCYSLHGDSFIISKPPHTPSSKAAKVPMRGFIDSNDVKENGALQFMSTYKRINIKIC